MMRRGLLLGLVALTLAAGSAPDAARADFRHPRMGARPRALGSAFVSLADDANAAHWNPAGLVCDPRLSFMVTRHWLYGLEEIGNDYLALDLPALGPLHAGASWVHLGIDDVYSEDTLNLAVGFHAPFLDGLSLGVAGKLFLLDAPGYEKYNDPNYTGGDHDYSFDLGLLYRSGRAWTLGAVVYNVASPELQLISTTEDPDPVFTEWAAGGSYLFRETLLVTADFRDREGVWDDVLLHGGAEIWFFDALVLRSGMDRDLVTMGAGLQDGHWQVDMTLETQKELGNVYMLSFTLRN